MTEKARVVSNIYIAAAPRIEKLLKECPDWKLSETGFARLKKDGVLKWDGLTKNQLLKILLQKDIRLETLCRIASGLGVNFGTLLGLGNWEIDLEGWPARLEKKAGLFKIDKKIERKTGLSRGFLYKIRDKQGMCLLSSVERVCQGFGVDLQALLSKQN
jgi:DNA-binding phage protein